MRREDGSSSSSRRRLRLHRGPSAGCRAPRFQVRRRVDLGRSRFGSHCADLASLSRGAGQHERLEARQLTRSGRRAEVLDFDLHGLGGDQDSSVRRHGTAPHGPATRASSSRRRSRAGHRDPLRGSAQEILARYATSGSMMLGSRTTRSSSSASRHKSPARVKIDFSQSVGPAEIVCERGLAAVPYARADLEPDAARQGCPPAPCVGVRPRRTGVVATGWSKGGKTEALLAFACARRRVRR